VVAAALVLTGAVTVTSVVTLVVVVRGAALDESRGSVKLDDELLDMVLLPRAVSFNDLL
jgi:hypothetical protein